MNVKVRNVVGTGGKTPTNYKSWIEFWEVEGARGKPKECSKIGCTETIGLDGGHVKKCSGDTGVLYIVPLCATCNNPGNTESFEVDDADLEKLKAGDTK